MSLKAFHLIFIIVSVLLFVATALWALVFSGDQSFGILALGAVSVVFALILSVYGFYFVKKAKDIIV